MKRRFLTIVPIIMICELICATVLFAFFVFSSKIPGNAADISPKSSIPEDGSFDVKAEVTTDGDRILVKSIIAFDKPATTLYVHMPSFNSADVEIRLISDGEQALAYEKKGTVLEVVSERQVKEISLEYEFLANAGSGLLSYRNSTYYLTNFIASPAVIKDGQPLNTYESKLGDPYIYEANDYHVTFKTEKNASVFAPGSRKEQIVGLSRITEFSAKKIRDFSAVISPGLEAQTFESGSVRVHYIGSSDARKYVEEALEYASGIFGPYPYDDLFVVKAPILLNGMEFSEMIFLSDNLFKNQENLRRVAYHEVLHQWFYGIIGTDQVNEPFLDEGLVQYLAMRLTNGSIGQYYDSSLFDMGLSDYSSAEQYNRMIYSHAAAYIGSIHRELGNNFYSMLQKIYEDKKYEILYFDSFEKYIEEFRGK